MPKVKDVHCSVFFLRCASRPIASILDVTACLLSNKLLTTNP